MVAKKSKPTGQLVTTSAGEAAMGTLDVGVSASRPGGRLFLAFVRNRFAVEARRAGVGFLESRRMAQEIDDEMIASAAVSVGIQAIGDGGFLDWLTGGGLAQIIEIVKILLGLFGMTYARPE